ncbi:MAG: sensor domain-containing diguanylate cyclase [Methylobacter sp.]
MNKKYRLLIFPILLGLCLLMPPVFAADKLLDASRIDQAPVSLTQYFAVLEDSGLALTLTDVQRPDVAARFKTDIPPAASLNFSLTSSAYWLRLHLNNSSDKPIERILEIAYPRLANIQFHQPGEHGYQSTYSGYSVPYPQRSHKSRFFVLPVSMPAHADQIMYLRIETPNSMDIPARLWERQAFYAHERNDYMIQAIYFGIASAMVLFNLLLFISLRDSSYLLYVIFACCTALANAALTGIANEFLWSNSVLLQKVGVNVCVSVMLATFMLFMRRMLMTVAVVPKLDRWIRKFIWVNAALPLFLVSMFEQVAKLTLVIHISTALLILATGMTCAVKRQRSAYFFIVAFAVFFLAIILTSLRALGVLPTNIITTSGPTFGSALEMLLLAFALADRYNVIREEKEKAQGAALEAQQLLVENLKSSEHILETRVAERTAELQILNRKLEALSTTDGLTGIANRRCFDKALENEWNRAIRLKQPLALAMIDVDWFKKYNDHYGHQGGDDCLKNIAAVLAANVCRTGDLVARYGGEEFAFIAPSTEGVAALNMANKIRDALQALALPHEMSGFGRVTASIGVAAIIPEQGLSPDILLKAADEALYSAKDQGRNRAVLAATGWEK